MSLRLASVAAVMSLRLASLPEETKGSREETVRT
jgi:hypothetical protein